MSHQQPSQRPVSDQLVVSATCQFVLVDIIPSFTWIKYTCIVWIEFDQEDWSLYYLLENHFRRTKIPAISDMRHFNKSSSYSTGLSHASE